MTSEVGTSRRNESATDALAVQVWGMRCAGLTFRQASEILGISMSYAYVLFKRAYATHVVEAADAAVAMEGERLDSLLRVCYATLEAHKSDPRVVALMADRILHIGAERRKMLGLDIQKGTVADQDLAEQELQDLIRNVKRGNRNEDLKSESGF